MTGAGAGVEDAGQKHLWLLNQRKSGAGILCQPHAHIDILMILLLLAHSTGTCLMLRLSGVQSAGTAKRRGGRGEDVTWG